MRAWAGVVLGWVTSWEVLCFFGTFCVDFIKEFWKILEFLLRKIDIRNTKHFRNSIIYYLLFDFLVFLTSFFLFYLSIVVKKLLKFLCCFIL